MLLILLPEYTLSDRIRFKQFPDQTRIAADGLFVFGVAVVILVEGFHEYHAAGFLVAKEGDCFIGSFFEIPEADDIAEGLYGVQDAVCP